MTSLSSMAQLQFGDPWTVSLLIGLLLILAFLIGRLPTPSPRSIQLPCRLHLWDVRQRRYVCRRCGLVPGQGPAGTDQG